MTNARAASAVVCQLDKEASQRHGPGVARDLVRSVRAFLDWRGELIDVPALDEARAWYAELEERHSQTSAEKRFLSFRRAAGEVWGAEETAHLAAIRRQAVIEQAAARKSEWDKAADAVSRLPTEWRLLFVRHLEASQARQRGAIWSAAHCQAVANALRNWKVFCDECGLDPLPTGASLERYANHVVSKGCSISSASDYLSRILNGFAVVLQPGFRSDACRFVVDRWDCRSWFEPPRTKTPDQILPASEIHALGYRLMEEATGRTWYDLDAAITCRNGLLLAFVTALPKRSRALSSFEFDHTVNLREGWIIEINIPGEFLKLPEAQKPGTTYRVSFENADLWQAADRYRRVFRPLFDDGLAVFPSARAKGGALRSSRLGQLVGDLTEKHLGTRVPAHRIRDCVATEATEHLLHGGRLAPILLGHSGTSSSEKHYEHAEGHEATRRLGDFVAGRRGRRPRLLVVE